MTTIYKFVCGYTKAGVATSPSSAPTITIVDSSNNILASAQATTARTNIAGVYDYIYSGADSLDLIGLFHTSDATVDRQDLHSHPYNAVILKAIETVDTVVDAIKAKTDNLPTNPADESLLEAAIAAIPSAPTAAVVADAVWDEALSGHVTAGTTGSKLIDLSNADLSSLATAANLSTVDTVVDAIKAKTDNLPSDPADQSLIMAAIAAVPSAPTALQIDTQLSGTHGTGLWGGASGSGSISWPITIDDGISPLDGVDVWVTTDSAGTNVVARGYTNTLGTVTFLLDAGPYYLWKQLSGYTFINPEGITVS